MRHIRKRLTYANVMSSIAVFLVLGGVAVAASQLPKNSVGTKQLKKNAVTGAKVKNGSLTGADIKLSTLGTVPSATHASSADNASSANNAGNANTTDGMHLGKFNFAAGKNTPKTSLISVDGLTLNASCDSTEQLEFTATTSVNNSEIYESGSYLATFNSGYDDNFNAGETELVGEKIGDHSQQEVQGQLVYSTPAGAVVTAQFSLNDSTQAYGGTQTCSVAGTVEFS